MSNKPTVTTEHSTPKPVDTVPQERNAEMPTVPVMESATPPKPPDTMPREQSEAETRSGQVIQSLIRYKYTWYKLLDV